MLADSEQPLENPPHSETPETTSQDTQAEALPIERPSSPLPTPGHLFAEAKQKARTMTDRGERHAYLEQARQEIAANIKEQLRAFGRGYQEVWQRMAAVSPFEQQTITADEINDIFAKNGCTVDLSHFGIPKTLLEIAQTHNLVSDYFIQCGLKPDSDLGDKIIVYLHTLMDYLKTHAPHILEQYRAAGKALPITATNDIIDLTSPLMCVQLMVSDSELLQSIRGESTAIAGFAHLSQISFTDMAKKTTHFLPLIIQRHVTNSQDSVGKKAQAATTQHEQNHIKLLHQDDRFIEGTPTPLGERLGSNTEDPVKWLPQIADRDIQSPTTIFSLQNEWRWTISLNMLTNIRDEVQAFSSVGLPTSEIYSRMITDYLSYLLKMDTQYYDDVIEQEIKALQTNLPDLDYEPTRREVRQLLAHDVAVIKTKSRELLIELLDLVDNVRALLETGGSMDNEAIDEQVAAILRFGNTTELERLNHYFKVAR